MCAVCRLRSPYVGWLHSAVDCRQRRGRVHQLYTILCDLAGPDSNEDPQVPFLASFSLLQLPFQINVMCTMPSIQLHSLNILLVHANPASCSTASCSHGREQSFVVTLFSTCQHDAVSHIVQVTQRREDYMLRLLSAGY